MAENKDKGVVEFGDPEYSSRLDAAKKGRVPLGGAPMPTIPRLDESPRDRHAGVQSAAMKHAMLTPEQQAMAVSQGGFIPGVGSAYASNQPKVRANPLAPPGEEPPPDPGVFQMQAPEGQAFANPPRGEGAGLRPETVAQLEAVAKANAGAPAPGAPPAATTPRDLAKEAEDLAKEVGVDDEELNYDEFGNRVRDILSNKQRRELIEKRCLPMKLEDLLIYQEVKQVVPIVPGKFEPTYRSTSGMEDLFIKRMVGSERGSPQYIADRYAILNLTAGLFAVNGRPLPAHLSADGEPTEDLFNAKLKMLLKFPITVLADLSVNYTWFGKRVQKLLVVDDIKGF